MKLKTLFLMLSLLFVAGAALTSCSKDDDDKDNKGGGTGTILGVWTSDKYYYEYETEAKVRMPHKAPPKVNSAYYEIIYVFTENGGCADIYVEYDATGQNVEYVSYWTGKYKFNSKNAIITWVGDGTPEVIPYRIGKNKLIFTYSDTETGEEWDEEFSRKNESYLNKVVGNYTIENYLTSRVWMSDSGWEPMYDEYYNTIGESGNFIIYNNDGTCVFLTVYRDDSGVFKSASRDNGTWIVEDYLLKEDFISRSDKESWIFLSFNDIYINKNFQESSSIEFEGWMDAGSEYDPEYLKKASVGAKKR